MRLKRAPDFLTYIKRVAVFGGRTGRRNNHKNGNYYETLRESKRRLFVEVSILILQTLALLAI